MMKQQWTPPARYLFLATLAAASASSQSLPVRAVSLLEQRCATCHGDQASMSDLRLTARDAILKGGKRGPAAKPGNAAESLLVNAILHNGKLAMPPGPKMPAEEIAIVRDWINQGMDWPTGAAAVRPKVNWWAFQKVQRPPVPSIENARNPIDAFLLEKLRAAKLEPAPEADRLTLLRRASFDLLGLPPTEQQIHDFLNDKAPDAWERLIDSLLASPRYGEKWARHWLDLARYGDTAGFEQDPYILEAWRYRDYVIKSFNDDKPYDRFAKEQIAGDELWSDDPDARTGTGFYRVGTNRDMLFKVEDLNRVEKLTDAVDTTSSVFLGLTVGCARCHDHKFDPIPQRDFYRMQAVFAPAVNDRAFLEYNSVRFYDIQANTRDFRLRQVATQIDAIFTPTRDRLKKEKGPDAKVTDEEVRAALTPADTERLQAIEHRLVSMFAGYGAPPTAPSITDVGREAPRTYIAIRGNPDNPGEEVGPGFLTALGGGDIPEPPLHARSTFRRKAFAEWTASADNPLFARVMVNRVWQYHFGAGLLKTPSDFGTRAGEPSHPQLLDYLATEFVNRKWSMKAMHGLIMTSDAYKRSANAPPAAQERDPANVLLSHMSRRRLQAEEIRDAVLQVSGTLNLKAGGGPVVPPLDKEELFGIIGSPNNAWMVTPDQSEHTRRSIYLLQRRTFQQPMFEAFDAPDGVLSCSRRNESTTAPQSLALFNGRFMTEQAKILAAKTHTIDEAWQRVLGRAPSVAEKQSATEFLARQTQRLNGDEPAMAELLRGLLNLNEFLYVE